MTTKIKIISNDDEQLGEIINRVLVTAQNVQIAVAFLTISGVKAISHALEQCLDNSGNVELIAGLDFNTTDAESIRYFMDLGKKYATLNFRCFSTENKKVFHPKIYLFDCGQMKIGVVGSSNLTDGGLNANFEVNTILEGEGSACLEQLQAIYDSVKSNYKIFIPDEEYVKLYSTAHKTALRGREQINENTELKLTNKELTRKENQLTINKKNTTLGNAEYHIAIRRKKNVASLDNPLGILVDGHKKHTPDHYKHLQIGQTVWLKWSPGDVVAKAKISAFDKADSISATRELTKGTPLYNHDVYWDEVAREGKKHFVVVRTTNAASCDPSTAPKPPRNNMKAWYVHFN